MMCVVYDTMYRMQHPRKKKPRKISDAVFRGKQSAYSFQVFPISSEITDTPAVFIISRRRIDKLGHGHQSAVCIGETDSMQSELKKHKRARCVKNNEPNVICVLEETNPTVRTGVLKDLTAVRKFGCIQSVYDSTVKPKSHEQVKIAQKPRVPAAEIKVVPAKSKTVQPSTKKKVVRTVIPNSRKASPAPARTTKAKQPKLIAASAREKSKPSTAARREQKRTAVAKKQIASSVSAKRSGVSGVPVARRAAAKSVEAGKKATFAKSVKKQTAAKPKTVRASASAKPAGNKSAAAKSARPAAKMNAAVKAKRAAKPAPVSAGGASRTRRKRLSGPRKAAGNRTKSQSERKSRSRQKAAA